MFHACTLLLYGQYQVGNNLEIQWEYHDNSVDITIWLGRA